MKHIAISAVVLLLGVSLVGAQTDEAKRITDATIVLDEIMGAADKAVPR